MNQPERIDELLKSGYQKCFTHDDFVCLFKRITGKDKNFIYPEYHDVTVFPNGRVADGEYRKWTKIKRRRETK